MIEVDRNGFEVLSREACLDLLGTASLGRVATHADALPIILPVQFLLTEHGVTFRTNVGTRLDAATRNAVVAFEADGLEDEGRSGWSVLVTGIAGTVTDPAELASLEQLPFGALSPRDAVYISISLALVSGRRTRQRPQRAHDGRRAGPQA